MISRFHGLFQIYWVDKVFFVQLEMYLDLKNVLVPLCPKSRHKTWVGAKKEKEFEN